MTAMRAAGLDLWDDFDHDFALVGPRDNRIHEIRTTRFPFNTVCHIERDFSRGKSSGCTGTLISPTTVLTAGHCLYSHLRGGPPRRVRISPGRSDRDTKPYGTIGVQEFFVPHHFVNPGEGTAGSRAAYDYGVLILSRPVTGIRRFSSVAAFDRERLLDLARHKPIMIAGYPGDRPVGTMWRHSEKLKKIGSRRLYYTVDTCPGHSGSPIWIRSKAGMELYLIGIHTSGILDEWGRSYGCKKGTTLAPANMLNSGVRITPTILQNIRNPHGSHATNEQLLRLG